MSATNRGSRRRKYDLYETPEEVTRDFLFNHFDGDYQNILEPCCGSGKITKVLRERYPKAQIMGIDLNLGLLPEGANQAIMADFLDFKDGEYDLIITNPPYSAAEPIITHTLKTWPNATVVMLLRLNFLGSQKRKPFWDKHPVSEFY